MNFIDEADIEVTSGKGGDGCVSFRRERFRPFGGPDGGDGGRGGSVILIADPELGTLLDLHYQHRYKARNGEPGMGSDCYGAKAEDLLVRLPVGTLVYDKDTDELLADLNQPGAELVAARGGRGGKGNIHFKSPTQQAPRRADAGEPGETRLLHLELKLLADVGVVGFPNTGKSTLVSRLSRAKPKVADYPFTTLVPTLGVVPSGEAGGFVMADVPGLIEGASQGKGLGHRFLKHVERCRLLVHLTSWMPGDPDDADLLVERLDMLDREMKAFDPELAAKPRLLAISKVDLPEVQAMVARVQERLAQRGLEALPISAVTGVGLKQLVGAIHRRLTADASDEESSQPS